MLDDFDMAVMRLYDSISTGRNVADAEDMGVVLRGVGRYVGATFPSLQREELLDVVGESLVKFTEAVREKRLDRNPNVAAYLVRIARNYAIDSLRTSGRTATEHANEFPALELDPDIERVLEALSSESLVRAAIRRAREQGDHNVNDVVRVWLNLAARRGEKPSLRDVGAVLGISHTEVRNRMGRLKHYLDRDPSSS